MATKTTCLDALETATDRLGSSPSKAAYEELGLTPAASTIVRVFGGWNAARERLDLETNPSTGSRTIPKPDDVSVPHGVEWDHLSQDQRWHYRDPDWNTERTLRRRARLRSWLNDRKAAVGCSRCGESDPACLDFYHRNPDEKDGSITDLVTDGYGRDRLEAECVKCDVLCANCHRREYFVHPLARFESE